MELTLQSIQRTAVNSLDMLLERSITEVLFIFNFNEEK